MIVGYVGPKGAYAHEATERLVEKLGLIDVEEVALDSIHDVFYTLDKKEIDSGVVPFKNTVLGQYPETVAHLRQYNPKTIGCLDLPIRLSLGVHPQTSPSLIQEIRSKENVLKECSVYLANHYPLARLVEVENYARAIREIMKERKVGVGAIGSLGLMENYGMRVLEREVGNSKDNITSFLYLKKR